MMIDAEGLSVSEYIDYARNSMGVAALAMELQQTEWRMEGFELVPLAMRKLDDDCEGCMKTAIGELLRSHPDAFISHDFDGNLLLRYKDARTADAARALKCCHKEHK